MSKAGHYLKLDSSSVHSIPGVFCNSWRGKRREKFYFNVSFCFNDLSNRGENTRNFLKQSWSSSKSTEKPRERGIMFWFVSFQQWLFLYGATGAWVNTVLKDEIENVQKALWDASLQGFAKEDSSAPPSLSIRIFWAGHPTYAAGLSTETSIHLSSSSPNATSVVSYKTKAQAQGVINKIWLTKSKLLVHHLSGVHFAFPPWSHQAAAWGNNLNVILTLYQFYSNLEQEDNKGKMRASGQNSPVVMS